MLRTADGGRSMTVAARDTQRRYRLAEGGRSVRRRRVLDASWALRPSVKLFVLRGCRRREALLRVDGRHGRPPRACQRTKGGWASSVPARVRARWGRRPRLNMACCRAVSTILLAADTRSRHPPGGRLAASTRQGTEQPSRSEVVPRICCRLATSDVRPLRVGHSSACGIHADHLESQSMPESLPIVANRHEASDR